MAKPTVGNNYINSTGTQWLLTSINEADPTLGLDNTTYVYKRPGETATLSRPLETLANNNDITNELVDNYDRVVGNIRSYSGRIDDLYKAIGENPNLIPKYVDDFKNYINEYNNILSSASSDFFSNEDIIQGNVSTLQNFIDQYDKPVPTGSPKPTSQPAPAKPAVEPLQTSTSYDSASARGEGTYKNGQPRRSTRQAGTNNITTYYDKDGGVKAQVIEGAEGQRHVKRMQDFDTGGKIERIAATQSIDANGTTTIYNNTPTSSRKREYNHSTGMVHEEMYQKSGDFESHSGKTYTYETKLRQQQSAPKSQPAPTQPQVEAPDVMRQHYNPGDARTTPFVQQPEAAPNVFNGGEQIRDNVFSPEYVDQNAVDALNKRATSDPNLTVGEYIEQMENITHTQNKVEADYQVQIDDLNRRATSDPNMTFDEYQKAMDQLVEKGEGASNITQDIQEQLTNMSEQEAIDDLYRRATSDPNVTFEEFYKAMEDIVGENTDPNIKQQIDAMNEQDAIDKLNRQATSDPNLTVEEYMKQMSDITGESINLKDVGSKIKDPNIIDLNGKRNIIEQQFEGGIPIKVTDADGNEKEILKKYKGNVKNGYVENVTFGEGDNEFTFDLKHRKDKWGEFDVYDPDGNIVLDNETLKHVNEAQRYGSNKFYHSLSDDEWETVIENAEQFRFDQFRDEGWEGRLKNQNAAINKRQEVLKNQADYFQEQYESGKTPDGKKMKKKTKERIKDARNQANVKNLELEKTLAKNKLHLESMDKKKNLGKEFNKTLGLDKFEKGSKEYFDALKDIKTNQADLYNSAVEKMREGVKTVDEARKLSISGANEKIDAQIKGLLSPPMDLGDAFTLVFTAKTAVDKYKESRAKGRGVVSSVARSATSAVIAETVGFTGSMVIAGAKALPAAAIKGADALYTEHRKMNSASNFRPLGGASFQDSQELATMRQSGMELAKMAQYNLEQTLMGSEAKHLHR